MSAILSNSCVVSPSFLVSCAMAPKKTTSSSGTTTAQRDAPAPSHFSQVKKLLKCFEKHISGDIIITLPSTSSPNNLGLGPAFLESAPSSFFSFYPPLPEEPLKHQRGVDLSRGCSSNTIWSWHVPSNDWIEWVNWVSKTKSTSWADSGILHAILHPNSEFHSTVLYFTQPWC